MLTVTLFAARKAALGTLAHNMEMPATVMNVQPDFGAITVIIHAVVIVTMVVHSMKELVIIVSQVGGEILVSLVVQTIVQSLAANRAVAPAMRVIQDIGIRIAQTFVP